MLARSSASVAWCRLHVSWTTVAASSSARAPRVEYDDACEEACAAAATGAGGSGMCIHACARCTLHAMVDQHSLLCAPCEEDEMDDEL